MLNKTDTQSDQDIDSSELSKMIKGMKFKFHSKVLILKISIIFLIFYLDILPIYLFLYNSYITILNVVSLGYLYDAFFVFTPILLILYGLLVIYIIKGKFPFTQINTVLFILSFVFIVGLEPLHIYWPLKIILAFLLYRLIIILEKYNLAFKTYKSYEQSYNELLRVNMVLDIVLRKNYFYALGLILLTYVLLLIFQFFTVDVGTLGAILLTVAVIPLIVFFLFKPLGIFNPSPSLEEN